MKKIIPIFILAMLIGVSKLKSQTLTCLTPTLVLSDPTISGDPTLTTSVIDCNYAGLIRVKTSPFTNNPISAGNSPCLRFYTSLTNTNSSTNNTVCVGQGTAVAGCLSPSNTSLYSLYFSGLTPSVAHGYTLCNNAIAPNMTYSVSSCYDNIILTSGTWTNTSASSCQTLTIPANSAIGAASFVISPTVSAAALIQNSGNGTIIYDPSQMAAGVYTISYTFATPNCTASASRTFQISNPFVGAGSTFTAPPALCPNGPCINLYGQLVPGAYGPGIWTGVGVTSNSFCPGTSGAGTFQITYSVGVTPVCSATNTNVFYVAPQPIANAGATKSLTCITNPTVLAGSGGGTYSWSNSTLGNNFSNSQTPTVSIAGTYSLVVNNGTCSSSPATMLVGSNTTPPAFPSTTISSVINCINTTATVLTSNTTPGATYVWSGPGIVGSSTSTTVVANLGGTYNYTVTNPLNGCTAISFVTITSNTAVPLTLTNGAAINCTNNVTTLSGNQASYSYTWTAPATGTINSGQNNQTANVTGTGIYTATVLNPANGCVASYTRIPTTNTTVITPNITTPGASIITCNTTTLNLNGTPATGVTYTWSTGNGNIVGNINTQNTTVGSGGIYTLSVRNATNGCVGTRTISIATNTTPPSAVNASPNSVMLACPAQTAIITGTATGATSYSWTAPAGGSILSGQNTTTVLVTSSSVGIFTLVATAANGCKAVDIVTVSPNTNAPMFTFSNATPSITCSNTTPSVTVIITSTVAISSYSWSPSTGISGPTNTSVATFTAAGSYTAIITATNGCISTAVIPVASNTVAPALVAGTGTAQTISCSNSLIPIDPSITPTSTNYAYNWSGPGIVGSSTGSSITVNSNGTYSLIVTNTLTGCVSTLITIPVNGNVAFPNLNISSSSSIGIGCSPTTSTITLTASSSVAVTYTWSTGDNTPSILTSSAGVYTVVVTDVSNNCSTTQTINVANNASVAGFSASAGGLLPCGATSTTQLNASSTSTDVSYTWSGNGIISGSNTPVATINQAGIYTVTAFDNATGCSVTTTIAAFQPTVIANFTANIVNGTAPLAIDFTNNSLGANSYTWNFGNSSTATSTNPSTSYLTNGTYTVTLAASNGTCIDTYTLEITVGTGLGIVPQLITPNGDGKNDKFNIIGLESYPKSVLKIYNRWGNIVYEASPYKNDWDGIPNKTSIGGGRLPIGSYFVILDYGDEKLEIYKGFVQLEY